MDRKGILFGIGAYLSWGFFPLYFKAIQNVPALQIMFHRVVWSFVFLAVVIAFRKEWRELIGKATSRRVLIIYALAGALLAINWLVYIYGVNSGQVVETSLGYYINPLVSVALGVVVLRERLRPAQWAPIGLAAAGVLYLTLSYGTLPWIALALAFSFGLYGLAKKLSPFGSLHGLMLETAILLLPALGFLLYAEGQGTGAFGHAGWETSLLLALSGILTMLPLLMFASAARSIPLWMVGLLQYIAPTGQFLIGVLVYHEPFNTTRIIGFSVIWAALLIFTIEGFIARRRAAARAGIQALKAEGRL